MDVQKATSSMKIEMTEKMYEAKKEMEAMDKKLLEAKEEAKENNEVMERKLSEAKMDMEEIIADKVKEGIQAYVESLGINIDANLKSEQVPDNPLKDFQQPSSVVPGVHTRKANMIKKTGTTVVGTNKKKWVCLKKLQDLSFFLKGGKFHWKEIITYFECRLINALSTIKTTNAEIETLKGGIKNGGYVTSDGDMEAKIEIPKTHMFKGACETQDVGYFLWNLENYFKCNKVKSVQNNINIVV
ncbi:uncharacterized protein [Solanum tuberosum]|uniref:uncharacterized protein n=1 Tax=Solanum tuberosum TaxID=4113 RepID=UPI0003D28442|nr:PREDICTED: uncharacterized protein LOC102592391 [Solanum tuberosum]